MLILGDDRRLSLPTRGLPSLLRADEGPLPAQTVVPLDAVAEKCVPKRKQGDAMDRGSDGKDAEAGDSFELGRVGGRDFHAMTYGGRRDPHVVSTDHFTVSL